MLAGFPCVTLFRCGTIALLGLAAPAAAQTPVSAVPTGPSLAIPAPSSYADVADYAVESATIIDATIRRTREVDAARAPNVPPNLVRLYVEAEVGTVIYGRNPVARRFAYLVDVPRLANGRAPRLNRQRVLLFARPVDLANQIRLVAPNAQLMWDAGRDSTVRAIAAELARGDVPPRITGVAQAFHVPGTIAGESETQIFLRTDSGNPVSLSILRRPGQAPRWGVAFGEIVDESAGVPARRTLGWYRLACGLPATLPRNAIDGLASADIAATVADYTLVVRTVGSCDRTPPAPIPVITPRR
jgi:hypothetical protein